MGKVVDLPVGAPPPAPVQAATAATNTCKLCAPLGACIAFRGIAGAVPFLHGGQGCSTYIRRYIISHFHEPIDIGSSSFSESTAIYGGSANLKVGLANIIAKYRPELIGVATTCLAETIGEDVPAVIREFAGEAREREKPGQSKLPILVPVSTPSYQGSHLDGFHSAVLAVVRTIAEGSRPHRRRDAHVNVLPGFVSPADIRYMKEVLADCGLAYTICPDYSETLDGGAWHEYLPIPPGGTLVQDIRDMQGAQATIQFGAAAVAGQYLADAFSVPCHRLGLPIGILETDKLFDLLTILTGKVVPAKYRTERSRLLDAYADGHKYLSRRKAVVYGEEDLVTGLAAFLAEVGMVPVLVAASGRSGRLRETVAEVVEQAVPGLSQEVATREDVDFAGIEAEAAQLAPDLIIGSSKGYPLARRLGIPLVRVGFPIHDRLGGQRLLHLGYRGAQQLFDTIVNAVIAQQQEQSPVGYSYM